MRDGWTRQFLKLLVWLAALLGVVALVLYAFFVEIVEVGHDGMAPTVVAGDLIVVWKRPGANMGDIVFCENPQESGQFVLGRVVGTRGMNLEVGRGGNLEISGTRIDHDYEGEVTFTDARGESRTMRYGHIKMGKTRHLFFEEPNRPASIRPISIETGVYLLGDNRSDGTYDSRTFGEVDPRRCSGLALLRLQPSGRAPAELEHGYLDILY